MELEYDDGIFEKSKSLGIILYPKVFEVLSLSKSIKLPVPSIY